MNQEDVTPSASPIRFGIFEVDLISGELRKRGVRIRLQEQPFQVLVALVQRPREVVTREELRKRLWPPDILVDFESGLNKAVNRLRVALGDDADNPRFVETLPQRGYRFLADVEAPPVDPHLEPASNENRPVSNRPSIARRSLLPLAAGSVAIPLLYVGYRSYFSAPHRIDAIAVLPLENLSGDIEQEYFSDGMTDELIGEIARIRSLRVISRTSIMRYKGGRRKSLPEIARELNVGAIIEGTIVKSGSRVRITAQLIQAQDERHLWSEQYERDFSDVLAVQRDVARAVASQIRMTLAPRDTSSARARRLNPAAYDAFLKGNFFLWQGIRGVGKSIDFFKRAIELDPSQAEAHAGLAEAYCYAGIFGFMSSAEAYTAARGAAVKALQLDDSNAGAHNALADVKKGYDWDFAGAEIEYKRALQFNPNHLLTHLWYAECLTRMSRFGEAIAESDIALALDPVSPNSLGNRAMLFFRARRYDEAIRASQQALDLNPNFVNALWWQGYAYAGKDDLLNSIACLTKANTMNDAPLIRSLLGYVYARAGEKAKARAILAELTRSSHTRFVSPMDFALVYSGLGDANSTFDWLEKACQSRASRVHELAAAPFDSLRSDPRYADLRRRVGLPLQASASDRTSPTSGRPGYVGRDVGRRRRGQRRGQTGTTAKGSDWYDRFAILLKTGDDSASLEGLGCFRVLQEAWNRAGSPFWEIVVGVWSDSDCGKVR
jgi:TolB-like protein/DNA-binding winged helix-turn-helix (wHTH) protein/Tfp pilus assembly protein PilF